MREFNLNPIEVVLTLKEKQKKGKGHWEVTIRGEKRDVLFGVVSYYADDIEEALNSFSIDEINSFCINNI